MKATAKVGRWAWLGLAVSSFASAALAAPSIFWASDPVRSGDTVVVIGDGFGKQPVIEVARIADSRAGKPAAEPLAWPADAARVEPIQPTDTSVKFAVPPGVGDGVFAFRITAPGGSATRLLNRPVVWWTQGDQGTSASPGGRLRLLGKNLGTLGRKAIVLLRGPKELSIATTVAGDYSVEVKLPERAPAGEYDAFVHNGRGGPAGWSVPVRVAIEPAARWPDAVFNVMDFGADGTGASDDTEAVQAALAKAEANRGGVVYFPRGRYKITGTLRVPRFTVLRGEREEWVNLFWADVPKPPESLIRGTNSFAIEKLTVYAGNHRHVIASDLGDQPEAGNVQLFQVRVRANAYRGHLKPEQVAERFRASLRLSTGGGDTVRLGGENIRITQCDLYGSGRALFLHRVRGGLVRGNRLYNGRWGWYCIAGSDGLVFEENRLTGGDLMSTGGGLDCLYGCPYSQNVYYAHNELRLLHGWDREAMTSDAGGECYFGKVESVSGAAMTLAGEPRWRPNAAGAGVFVLDGRGAGQWRRLVRFDGRRVELDRPWLVPPDAQSDVCITMFQGHYILYGNNFTDTGAVQFYGTSVECIVDANTGVRMAGFRGLGLWYHGYQPSWYCQFLRNRIAEGNYYHWTSSTEASLEVYGAQRGDYHGPLNRATIVRGNQLDNNAHISIRGTCRDTVVERNRVANAQRGIFVSEKCSNVHVSGNQFNNVEREVTDEAAERRAAEERLKKFIGRHDPIAAWSFEAIANNSFPDASGNRFHAHIEGNVAQADGGIKGKAASFDGQSCLRVSETAAFNAPDVTIALWVKPTTLRGRRGLVAKRYSNQAAPFVLALRGSSFTFEATEEGGPWSFNFGAPAALEAGQWTHLCAVVRHGDGVTLYVNGKAVARKKNAANRVRTSGPLTLGREPWGGDPPSTTTPGYYSGLMDEVKIWARALTAEEVRADYAAAKP